MGRNTWESIGGKPLPNRRNVVLTHNTEYTATGAEIVHSVNEALELAKQDDLWVIGGAGVFRDLLTHSDRLLVTLIDEEIEGDTFFPEMDWGEFVLSEEKEGIRDEKNPYHYRFLTYLRRASTAK